MKIAITGGTGHVGASLCRALLERGHQLRVLIRDDSRALDGLEVEKVPGDIIRPEATLELVKGCELLFHLAAKISIAGDPDGSVHATNVTGTQNVILACREQGVKLVHFSSIHAYCPYPLHLAIDEFSPYDLGPGAYAYARTKAEGEKRVLQAITEGLEALVLNPTGILGPNDFGPSLAGRGVIDMYKKRYPMLVAGVADKEAASRTLPMINEVLVYPTMIIVDRQGAVRHIHTGFPGQATGALHEQFKAEFNTIMDELLAEQG